MAQDSLGTLDKARPLLLIAAIAAGLSFGILLPHFVMGWFEDIVYFALIGLVYSLALGAPFGDVAKSFKNIRFFSVAWLVNFLVVPLAAFGLALVFLGPYPAVFVGFLLYSIAPCTDWFLIFTAMAKGDVCLGLALLPTNLILQVVLIPVYLFLFAGLIVPFQVSALAETLLVFIALPFALAAVTRWGLRKAASAEWRERIVTKNLPNLQIAILVVVIFFMFAGQAQIILGSIGALSIIFIPTILLFSIAFSLTQLLSRKLRFKYGECALLSFTTIARNSPIGLAIAVGLFPAEPLIQAAIILPEIVELPVLLLLVKVLEVIRRRVYHAAESVATMEKQAKA
jgi:ACR3 family arsenite transporter